MKILSVFTNGNEIAIRNNLWGQEIILYNNTEVSRKSSLFGATHCFEVWEERELVEYVVKLGFNVHGVSMNVWRNGEFIVKGLGATYERCQPSYRHDLPPPAGSSPSYHRDLV